MTLTKDKIVEDISSTTDLKKYHATKAIEGILEIIKKTLVSGEDVLVSGFGRFCVKEKKARKGRNPQTGETLMLRPRRIVTFLCSSVLKDKINVKDRV
jgi:integration host factor subunit alpha